jgi:hypothetical protein
MPRGGGSPCRPQVDLTGEGSSSPAPVSAGRSGGSGVSSSSRGTVEPPPLHRPPRTSAGRCNVDLGNAPSQRRGLRPRPGDIPQSTGHHCIFPSAHRRHSSIQALFGRPAQRGDEPATPLISSLSTLHFPLLHGRTHSHFKLKKMLTISNIFRSSVGCATGCCFRG